MIPFIDSKIPYKAHNLQILVRIKGVLFHDQIKGECDVLGIAGDLCCAQQVAMQVL